MIRQLSILALVLLLGANLVAAQPAAPQECDPYAPGPSLAITAADLSTPPGSPNAFAAQEIGINPSVLITIANNMNEIEVPRADFANPNSHLKPAASAIVTSAGGQLKVYRGICSDAQVLGELWAGERVTVLDGPLASEGLAWWRVRRNSLTGWVVEGQDNQLWLKGM